MRISDWSSDVCSSDLHHRRQRTLPESRFQAPIVLRDGAEVHGEHAGGAGGNRRERPPPLAGGLSSGRGDGHRRRDRKRVVLGQSVSVRVDLGGSRIIKKKIRLEKTYNTVRVHI